MLVKNLPGANLVAPSSDRISAEKQLLLRIKNTCGFLASILDQDMLEIVEKAGNESESLNQLAYRKVRTGRDFRAIDGSSIVKSEEELLQDIHEAVLELEKDPEKYLKLVLESDKELQPSFLLGRFDDAELREAFIQSTGTSFGKLMHVIFGDNVHLWGKLINEQGTVRERREFIREYLKLRDYQNQVHIDNVLKLEAQAKQSENKKQHSKTPNDIARSLAMARYHYAPLFHGSQMNSIPKSAA